MDATYMKTRRNISRTNTETCLESYHSTWGKSGRKTVECSAEGCKTAVPLLSAKAKWGDKEWPFRSGTEVFCNPYCKRRSLQSTSISKANEKTSGAVLPNSRLTLPEPEPATSSNTTSLGSKRPIASPNHDEGRDQRSRRIRQEFEGRF
ncbi:hypothetical protein IAR55_005540 [Kwoniella newhampshirensis]|uniref:Stc1 domain-containing protein n=1 Tax=Kwoniella newhampshirensis TaxID=1651941 RepID=A0AAW0YW21_9TREE